LEECNEENGGLKSQNEKATEELEVGIIFFISQKKNFRLYEINVRFWNF
jgi:hypothetical protein